MLIGICFYFREQDANSFAQDYSLKITPGNVSLSVCLCVNENRVSILNF